MKTNERLTKPNQTTKTHRTCFESVNSVQFIASRVYHLLRGGNFRLLSSYLGFFRFSSPLLLKEGRIIVMLQAAKVVSFYV